jgi:hypothetical protein
MPAMPEKQPQKWNPALTEDFLDKVAFGGLLEMDDDDDHDFSKMLVHNYFDQVEGSFEPIETGMYLDLLSLRHIC